MQDGSDFDIDIDNIDLDAIPIVLTTPQSVNSHTWGRVTE